MSRIDTLCISSTDLRSVHDALGHEIVSAVQVGPQEFLEGNALNDWDPCMAISLLRCLLLYSAHTKQNSRCARAGDH